MRLIVGISGASGVVMGYYMLKALRSVPDMEIHLIITDGAKKTFPLETEVSIHEVEALADVVHSSHNCQRLCRQFASQSGGCLP